MADCKKYRDMISSYADGELSGNDKSDLQKHLEACASCRSLLSLYKSISAAAAESLAEPPDSFTDSVMSKIKPLSEEANADKNTESKHKKSLRPVIISFVAAAACLALAFMVSPGLFGLIGSRNSAASVPMASAAPAAYDAEMQETTAEDNAWKAEFRSDSDGNLAGAASDVPSGAADGAAATTPSSMGITAATAPLPPEAGEGPEYPMAAQGTTDELAVYYAVFIIEGQLPDVLNEKAKTDNRDGTFNIEISAETAEQLIEDGLPAEKGAPEAVIALVKYTPKS